MKYRTTRGRVRGRVLAALTGFAVIVPLAACSAGGGESDGPSSIRFQTYQGPDIVEVWEGQWATFEEESGVAVEIETVPNAEQSQRLLTQAASGQLPDVAMVSARWFTALASRGLLEPLNSENLPGLDLADIQPVLNEAYTYDGVTYGVPSDLDLGLLFYNKDIFAASGTAEPSADWTWDDFRETAQALTVGEGSGKQFGADISGAGNWGVISAIANSYGGGLIDPATGVPTVDSGGGLQAVELFDEMLRVDKSTPPPGTENAQIGNGQIAMGLYGPWAAYYYLKDATFDWGVTAMPRGEDSTTFGWGSVLVVFKDSENKEGAYRFIENFLKKEYQTQRAIDWAWTPPSKSLLEDAEFGASEALAMTAEQKAVVAAAVGTAVAPPLFLDQAKAEDILGEVLSEMAAGTTDAEKAAARLTDGWGPLIK
jgi:multiple sugar transport system substrate-binding protein